VQGTLWYTASVHEANARDWLAQARRGVIELCVLSLIAHAPRYGYQLATALAELGKPLASSEGTLYPLLRRLESQGLLVSEWREEDKRNKRFYRISREGKVVLKQLLSEWQSIGRSLESVLKES